MFACLDLTGDSRQTKNAILDNTFVGLWWLE